MMLFLKLQIFCKNKTGPYKQQTFTGHTMDFNNRQNPYNKASPKTNKVKVFIKTNRPNLNSKNAKRKTMNIKNDNHWITGSWLGTGT